MSEKVQVPTIGRILHYTYGDNDRVENAAAGAIRPAIVTRVRRVAEIDGGAPFCDVVVFTAGIRDFLPGREGFAGTLSKNDVPVSVDPERGSLHWPARQ